MRRPKRRSIAKPPFRSHGAAGSRKSRARRASMTNLSWSVPNGMCCSAAHFLRCASREALKAAAEPNSLSEVHAATADGVRGLSRCLAGRPGCRRRLLRARGLYGPLPGADFRRTSPRSQRVRDRLLAPAPSWHAAGRHVEQGAQRRGHAKPCRVPRCPPGRAVALWTTHPAGWSFPKRRRDGQVDFRRGAVPRGRGGSRADSWATTACGFVLPVAAPERQPHEVVVLARREAR